MDLITDTESVHGDFRLWITTEVHPHFPIGLLQVRILFVGTRISYGKTYNLSKKTTVIISTRGHTE